MPLPSLTHLQSLAISLLLEQPGAGRLLRQRLKEHGVRQSGPAFYQFMAGLEDAGLVEGRYEQQIVKGQIIRERHYQVLANGRRALKDVQDFYSSRLPVPTRSLGHAR